MTNNSFWNEDWMKLQQQYWQQLNEFSQKAMGKEQPSWNGFNWNDAMSQWWQSISPAMPDANKSFMDKMLEQGSVFFKMNEQLANNLDKSNDWTEMLTNVFEQLQSGFASQAEKATGNMEDSFNKAMGFWQSPMENWRQMSSSIDINQNFLNSSNLFEKLLDAPGLGYTREDENRYKQLMQAALHYQHAMMDYNRFFADMGTQSINCMKDKVKQVADKGETIDSGRALYDLWVGACEKVYSEHALTPEYAKVHGELINAQMSLKKQWEDLVDQRLGMLNMPTRREMRTIQTRLQESRRETRALQSQVTDLTEAVESLKEQLKQQSATASTTTRKKTARSGSTVKKKVSKKTVRKKSAAKKA